jgi:hypothetical protein
VSVVKLVTRSDPARLSTTPMARNTPEIKDTSERRYIMRPRRKERRGEGPTIEARRASVNLVAEVAREFAPAREATL